MPDYVFPGIGHLKKLDPCHRRSAARRLAQERQVSLTGTLGILVTLVREQTLSLSVANELLTDMIRQRYRSPVDRLDAII